MGEFLIAILKRLSSPADFGYSTAGVVVGALVGGPIGAIVGGTGGYLVKKLTISSNPLLASKPGQTPIVSVKK
jgi:uncharacterized membrane protein